MLGIITNLFKKENSKDDAKNRLKLVLIQDRAMLSSGVLENMKDDILKVLSKYVEIEKSKLNIEVSPYDDDLNRKYRDKNPDLNKILTQQVKIGKNYI